MAKRYVWIAAAYGAAAIALTPVLAKVAKCQSTPEAVVQGDGGWGANSGSVGGDGQRWNAAGLRLEDGRLLGRIEVSGSSLFDSANVDAKLSGQGLTGHLLDDEGKELATFEGGIANGSASGTYRDQKGQTGEWKWEGLPPGMNP